MGIEFQEDTFEKFNRNTTPAAEAKNSKFAQWLIKKGFVKNLASANIILIIISVLIFGISIYIFKFGFHFPPRG